MQDWAAAISAGIDSAAATRPKSLLVLLNPLSGRRLALRLYRRVVQPLFAAAGIRTAVRQTQRQGHARELVAQLGAEDLRGIDSACGRLHSQQLHLAGQHCGEPAVACTPLQAAAWGPHRLPSPLNPSSHAGIVCVGGDGIFHEVLNGLLQARAAAAADPGAAELAALLGGVRLAHIPAGSTDAVACTLHGTRSAAAAALHVCLGDCAPLDVLRVDHPGSTTFASCIAGGWAGWD